MGETLGRQENMASPGTRGKSVGVVLAEAEYITIYVHIVYHAGGFSRYSNKFYIQKIQWNVH